MAVAAVENSMAHGMHSTICTLAADEPLRFLQTGGTRQPVPIELTLTAVLPPLATACALPLAPAA